jgi:hypothetical protein
LILRAFQNALAVSAAFFCAHLSAADYSIRLHRPQQAGEKSRMTVRLTERQERRLTFGEQVREKKESQTVEFAATEQVDSVDDKGHVTKATFTVDKCLRTVQTGSTNLIPKGTVITASGKNGKTIFTYQGGEAVPDEASQLLLSFVSIYNGGADDDEIFGTRGRKKTGDSWPINVEAARRDFQKKQPELTLESVNGSTKLKRVARFSGMDCLELEAFLQLKPTPKEPPVGMNLESSTVTGTFAGRFPVDESKQPLYGLLEFTLKMTLTGKVGPTQPEGRAEITNYRRVERHYSEGSGSTQSE